jgi:ribosome-associated translation inhibitor RaiA
MKIYSPNAEERAFLYQEAQDLEALMKDLGSLTVMVEEVKNRFRVTFVVAPESVGMKVAATDANIYDATIAAKSEAQRQLNAIVNSLPRQFNGGPETLNIPRELLH